MPSSDRPAAVYSEATKRVIDLALEQLNGKLGAPTVAALRVLADRGALGDVDAVVDAFTETGSDHAD